MEGPSQGVREQGLMHQHPLVRSSSRLRQILTTERQCVCVCARARACEVISVMSNSLRSHGL